MKKIALLLCLVLCFSVFSGCSNSGKTVLRVYNWGEYIDESVIKEFEKRFPDIRVQYETYTDNEIMYTKITNSSTKYDVLIPSDYMIERLIGENMLAPLNFDNIPNYSLIDNKYKNLDFDPENKYSVPYMWGTLGILYDKTKVHEEHFTWEMLFDGKYANSILMKKDMRDALGVSLKSLGYSFNSVDAGELNAAKDRLSAQKNNVLAYVNDDGMDKMIAGEAPMALMYSGDAAYCISENDNLAFAIPEDGSNLFFDSMVIPANSEHKDAAEKFINFMCEKEIAEKNANEIGYSTPHTGVYEALPAEVKNSFAYPETDILEKAEIYKYLGEEITSMYERVWSEFQASL
ncbi:MAG: ABC transporter substrate-binding protein [Clostridia bacterium]|nr:ABC transporter substrate-binding protein [Clostridia bacterium]